jgi:hypothetical protein
MLVGFGCLGNSRAVLHESHQGGRSVHGNYSRAFDPFIASIGRQDGHGCQNGSTSLLRSLELARLRRRRRDARHYFSFDIRNLKRDKSVCSLKEAVSRQINEPLQSEKEKEKLASADGIGALW